MKVKDLKSLLDELDDEVEILAEEKISGDEWLFDSLMNVYTKTNEKGERTIVFYQR